MLANFFIFTAIWLLFKDGQCESTEVLVEVGSLAVLPCRATPPKVSPAVTWTNSKGSVWKMQKSGLRFYNKALASRVKCPNAHLGDYSLHIQSVTEEDGGSYTCTLLQDSSRTPETTDITLRVITVSIWPAAPVMGQSVQVSCSVTGDKWPVGARVQWTLNDSPYEAREASRGGVAGFRRNTRYRDTELRMRAADGVKGTWTCVVTHRSTVWRVSALMDVKGIIQPPDDSTKIYAAVGSAVKLPCVFSSGLTTSNVLWGRLRGNSSSETSSVGTLPPSFSDPHPHISARDKTAGLSEVGFEDAGWYSCSASVETSRVERRMQLVTAKVGVEVLSEEEGTLTLTCDLSDTSGVTEYEWIYAPFDLNGTQFVASVQKGRSVTPSQASGGEWTCCFYGNQGLLGNVTYHIQHMERLSEDKTTSVLQKAVVLIGLSLLLMILLLTLNQMYKNHQRRKKILQFPALETIIHNKSVEQEMIERRQTKTVN